MNNHFSFEGVIRNVHYDPHTRIRKLKAYRIEDFDINQTATIGIIDFGENTLIGYARWKGTKRTRTNTLPGTYNVYHLPKKVVIIPIIKDEGYQANLDRINSITFSWMNLANVYIILTWYEDAVKHSTRDGRITRQTLNADFVNQRLAEIRTYQQTALHWNVHHFEQHFEYVYRKAVESYATIAQKTGARLVPAERHLAVLESYMKDDVFHLDTFRTTSLERSLKAASRETSVEHIHEYLEGEKAYFYITNYLGGQYHLTCDEILIENSQFIIQESKNTTKHKLPTLADIQDGLFKLILFLNIDELRLNGEGVSFAVRLKLTGRLNGKLILPANQDDLSRYVRQNNLTTKESTIITLLNQETDANPKLRVELNANA